MSRASEHTVMSHQTREPLPVLDQPDPSCSRLSNASTTELRYARSKTITAARVGASAS